MVEQFKVILEQLEPKLGKYKNITALVEDEYPRHDNGTYTGNTIWVEFEDQWLMLYQGPDKGGEEFDKIGSFVTKPNSIWDCEDFGTELLQLMGKEDINIADIADEIYSSTHMFITRTIDLESITESDVLYMINCTKDVLEAKSLQETMKKGIKC